MSLVRVQPGEPTTSRTSEATSPDRQALALIPELFPEKAGISPARFHTSPNCPSSRWLPGSCPNITRPSRGQQFFRHRRGSAADSAAREEQQSTRSRGDEHEQEISMSGKGGTEARAAVVLLVTMTVWSAALGRVWAEVTTPAEPPPTTEPAPSTTGPFPGATVRVFDTLAPLGATPGESLEDPTGLTGHGTSFPTIVTTYARDNHPVGPSGLSYWNPDCGLFTLYGKTVGFPGGVDINLTGPVQSAPSFAFGDVTFGPGDVWVPGLQEHPLYVHFAGTNRFRTFGTPSRTTPSDEIGRAHV